MKNKSYKILMAITMMSAAIYSGGCQKIVESAVVEEKDAADDSNESAEGQNEDDKSFSGKTAAEQVQAPERYTTTLKSEISPVNRTDTENGMKFTLTADAEVIVPDVDSICLKKTSRNIEESQLREILDKILQGETAQNIKQYEDGSESGDFILNGINYSYYLKGGNNSAFSIDTADDGGDWIGTAETPVDEEILNAQREYAKKFELAGGIGTSMTEEGALKYLKDLLGDDWQVGSYECFDRALETENGKQKQESVYFEQLVDGVPITYVQSDWLPLGDIIESDMFKEKQAANEKSGDTTGFIDSQSNVEADFWNGVMNHFDFSKTVIVSSVSDEPLFLLPFEEISAIFEDTIASQIMMDDDWERVNADYIVSDDDGTAVTSYSYRYPSADAQEVNITISKVKLGYMNQEEGNDGTEGTLIPVWDFFGTWTAQDAGSNKNEEAETVLMDQENVPMLTIDARDGSIIQRTSILQSVVE